MVAEHAKFLHLTLKVFVEYSVPTLLTAQWTCPSLSLYPGSSFRWEVLPTAWREARLNQQTTVHWAEEVARRLLGKWIFYFCCRSWTKYCMLLCKPALIKVENTQAIQSLTMHLKHCGAIKNYYSKTCYTFLLLDAGSVCSVQCSNLKFYTADMAFRPSGLWWQLLVKCGRHSIMWGEAGATTRMSLDIWSQLGALLRRTSSSFFVVANLKQGVEIEM